MFHIIEDAPVRYRRSFWVSRLNEDGTDAGVGAIPNTARAQEWLNEQGNCNDKHARIHFVLIELSYFLFLNTIVSF